MINPKSEFPKSESNPNGEFPMPERRAGQSPYDLCERTAVFGEAIIKFAKTIPVNAVTMRLISRA